MWILGCIILCIVLCIAIIQFFRGAGDILEFHANRFADEDIRFEQEMNSLFGDVTGETNDS